MKYTGIAIVCWKWETGTLKRKAYKRRNLPKSSKTFRYSSGGCFIALTVLYPFSSMIAPSIFPNLISKSSVVDAEVKKDQEIEGADDPGENGSALFFGFLRDFQLYPWNLTRSQVHCGKRLRLFSVFLSECLLYQSGNQVRKHRQSTFETVSLSVVDADEKYGDPRGERDGVVADFFVLRSAFFGRSVGGDDTSLSDFRCFRSDELSFVRYRHGIVDFLDGRRLGNFAFKVSRWWGSFSVWSSLSSVWSADIRPSRLCSLSMRASILCSESPFFKHLYNVKKAEFITQLGPQCLSTSGNSVNIIIHT